MQLTSEHEAVEPLSLLALSWQLLNFYFYSEIKVPKEINYWILMISWDPLAEIVEQLFFPLCCSLPTANRDKPQARLMLLRNKSYFMIII